VKIHADWTGGYNALVLKQMLLDNWALLLLPWGYLDFTRGVCHSFAISREIRCRCVTTHSLAVHTTLLSLYWTHFVLSRSLTQPPFSRVCELSRIELDLPTHVMAGWHLSLRCRRRKKTGSGPIPYQNRQIKPSISSERSIIPYVSKYLHLLTSRITFEHSSY
jgi:hypothetical protein